MGGFNSLVTKLFGATQEPEVARTLPRKSALRYKSGVTLGAVGGRPLIDFSMNPVAVLAPFRSGKSTAFIVPALLTWQGSAVVIDVAEDLHSLTAHWRRTGARNEVRRLALGDLSSPDTFNFLDAIPRGTPNELVEIQELAAILLSDRHGHNAELRDHAQSLLTLFIIAKRPNLVGSLYDVQQAVVHDDVFLATIAIYCDLVPENELGRAACASALAFTELTGPTRADARLMVAEALEIFASSDVARNTARSSFDLAELRNGEAPMTVYVTVAAHDLERLQRLIRVFLAQVVHRCAQKAAHRLLLVLDDFSALGRLEVLEGALNHLPDFDVKPLLCVESLTQLNQTYGKENTVWSQCAVRVVLPVDDVDTAVVVAEEIAGIAARARRTGAERRPNITSEELLRLRRGDAIILGVGEEPILAGTLPYYQDAVLSARVTASGVCMPAVAKQATVAWGPRT